MRIIPSKVTDLTELQDLMKEMQTDSGQEPEMPNTMHSDVDQPRKPPSLPPSL